MTGVLAGFADELTKLGAAEQGAKKEHSKWRIPLMAGLGLLGAGAGVVGGGVLGAGAGVGAYRLENAIRKAIGRRRYRRNPKKFIRPLEKGESSMVDLIDGIVEIQVGAAAGVMAAPIGAGYGAYRGARLGNRLSKKDAEKTAASQKNPAAGVETKMDKLLKGGLQRYVGKPEIRHPTFPPMAEVANRPYKDRAPKIDTRPPKPPG
ncbi:MAG: hypothetical protein JRG90_12580 [Deltaproteobacteria bacterium]|nr:hypothetical protein [Deltaproteobacteria bacterium]